MKNDKCHIRKNDKVKIIAGKDKGKVGKVTSVLLKKDRVMVENINMIKKHTRPSAKNRQGGIVETEGAIHWSNVMLMCNKCMKPVRVKIEQLEDRKTALSEANKKLQEQIYELTSINKQLETQAAEHQKLDEMMGNYAKGSGKSMLPVTSVVRKKNCGR